MATHPARLIPFDELKAGLDRAVGQGLVSRVTGPHRGLELYCYTRQCAWEKRWDRFTTLARGLILGPDRVVATPFPKFFNLLEVPEARLPLPGEPFEAWEKIDGSLIVAFHHEGKWRAATKGSFVSDQAAWAQARLDSHDLSRLVPGTTYLFEAVYPENRIVVGYQGEWLYVLGAYDEWGNELHHHQLVPAFSQNEGFHMPARGRFTGVEEFEQFRRHAAGLPADKEGYVIRYHDGTRVKLKGDEYRRIHKLIARVTPLGIWDCLANGTADIEALRAQLPPSFQQDFDAIRSALCDRVATLAGKAASAVHATRYFTDKELGLRLAELVPDEAVRPFVFPMRKGHTQTDRFKQSVWRAVRPAGNNLPGYTPSARVQAIQDDPLNP